MKGVKNTWGISSFLWWRTKGRSQLPRFAYMNIIHPHAPHFQSNVDTLQTGTKPITAAPIM